MAAKSLIRNRAARRLTISIVAIVCVLIVYGFYRHSTGTSSAASEYVGKNRATTAKPPVNADREDAKKLCQDFIAQLDQNMADHNGDGFKRNQSLAFDTMMQLKERQNKTTDSEALKYLDDFYSLVNKYYDQLVRYNSEADHLAEINQQINSGIETIKQDPSMSPEDKFAKKGDLKYKFFEEAQNRSIASQDVEATANSLRNFSVSTANN